VQREDFLILQFKMSAQLRRERDEIYVAYKRMRTSYENAVVVMNGLHGEIAAQDAEIHDLRVALRRDQANLVTDHVLPPLSPSAMVDLFGETSSDNDEATDDGEAYESSANDTAEESDLDASGEEEGGFSSDEDSRHDSDDSSSFVWSDADMQRILRRITTWMRCSIGQVGCRVTLTRMMPMTLRKTHSRMGQLTFHLT
jgi:hypothetical protein